MVEIPSPCLCEETERKATDWPEPTDSLAGQKMFSFPNIGLTGNKLISRMVQIVCHAGLAGIAVIAVPELELHIVVGAIIIAAARHRRDFSQFWTCNRENINIVTQ